MTDNTLITHHDPKSPVAEAFRTLRTNIQFASPDQEIKTVLITSAGPSEGKSTINANLAITMAQAGQNVILVDADMRRPTQHKIFELTQAPGLTNILMKREGLDGGIKKTPIENLSIITSGPVPPNPSELLGSKAFKDLMGELKERADMIIFDVPPVGAVTDAQVIAPQMDGVFLLINAGVANRELVKGAKSLLEKVGANILGAILNNVSSKDGYGYYYYYYYQDD